MLTSGVDAVAGKHETIGLRYATIWFPCRSSAAPNGTLSGISSTAKKCGTGYDARLVDSSGAEKNGIEKTKDKMVAAACFSMSRASKGRLARRCYGISVDEVERCADAQKVEIRKGDSSSSRTGHMERCLASGEWGGYAGGDAPGLALKTADWDSPHRYGRHLRDTWGCEVRPNETDKPISQPWTGL